MLIPRPFGMCLLSRLSLDNFSSRWNRGKGDARRTAEKSCMRIGAVLLAPFPLNRILKVATVIRVPVRRGVIRVRVRETVVRPIVPVATKTNGAEDVGIDEVGIASPIPLVINSYIFRGQVPSSPAANSPLTERRKGRPQKTRTRSTEQNAHTRTRSRRKPHRTSCHRNGQSGRWGN